MSKCSSKLNLNCLSVFVVKMHAFNGKSMKKNKIMGDQLISKKFIEHKKKSQY